MPITSAQRLNLLLKRAMRERIALSLIMAVLLVVKCGFFRVDHVGVHPEKFWYNKLSWTHTADIVFAGNSRVLGSISPAEVQHYLSNQRCQNYGFPGNRYSQEYLDAIQQVLDPQSHRPTIVLGISPASLMANIEKFGFIPKKKQMVSSSILQKQYENYFPFTPMGTRAFLQMLLPIKSQLNHRREFFLDGWIATIHPIDLNRDPEKYKQIFINDQVDPGIIDQLMAQVNRWTQSGITVYAFRPPTCVKMVEIENELSGFDENLFQLQIEEAGGRWIEVDQYAYLSYDGNHMHQDGAIKFSRDLARKIAAHADPKPLPVLTSVPF